MQQQVKPTAAVMGVVAFVGLLGALFYLRSIGVGMPAAGPPPGVAQMKQTNNSETAKIPPAPAAYIPPGAPAGVRQMIIQGRSGVAPSAPAPAAYIPPGAPAGVRQMIQQNPRGGTPGMPPSAP